MVTVTGVGRGGRTSNILETKQTNCTQAISWVVMLLGRMGMGWGGFIFHCNRRDTFLLYIQNIDYFNLRSEFYYNNFNFKTGKFRSRHRVRKSNKLKKLRSPQSRSDGR